MVPIRYPQSSGISLDVRASRCVWDRANKRIYCSWHTVKCIYSGSLSNNPRTLFYLDNAEMCADIIKSFPYANHADFRFPLGVYQNRDLYNDAYFGFVPVDGRVIIWFETALNKGNVTINFTIQY